MIALVFDTETSGLIQRRLAYNNPLQPHIVQLAAMLVDADDPDARPITAINTLIKPTDWSIKEEAASVHGISQEMAATYGWDLAETLAIFMGMVGKADILVGHNLAFDAQMLARELEYAQVESAHLLEKQQFCTMRHSTDICKIRSEWGGYKWPTLTEAYMYFYQLPFEDAHDAMADVKACYKIYMKLLELRSSGGSS